MTEPIVPLSEATAPIVARKTPLVRYALVIAALAFTALLLWLNFQEQDVYLYGHDAPPAGPINQSPPGWLPEAEELTECLIVCRVEDEDGWYRLFWAGTDIYYFDDASYFGAALANPTARAWSGRWTFKGKYKGRPFELTYVLREEQALGDEVAVVGPIVVPAAAPWFTRDYVKGRRTFSWVLEAPQK